MSALPAMAGTGLERRGLLVRGLRRAGLLFGLLLLGLGCVGPEASSPTASSPISVDPAAASARIEEARARLERRTPATLREARELYAEAAALDPRSARAPAGVAICTALLALYGAESPAEAWPRARAAADEALQRDEQQAEAWAAKGLIAFLADRDDPAADAAFRAAIQRDGSQAALWHWWAMVARAGGDSATALERLGTALALDPGARILRVKEGTLLAEAGRVEEGLARLRTALHDDPDFAVAHRALGMALLRAGHADEAALAYERAWECSPGSGSSAAGACFAWAQAGRPEQARAWQARVPADDPLHHAVSHSAFAEWDAAFAALQEAVERQDPGRVYLGVHPTFALLVDRPEGQVWLRTLRLR